MKKTSFYLTLLLGTLAGSVVSTLHASFHDFDYEEMPSEPSEKSSPVVGYMRRDNYQNCELSQQHKEAALEVRDLMTEELEKAREQRQHQRAVTAKSLAEYKSQKTEIELTIEQYEQIIREGQGKTPKEIKEEFERDKKYCEEDLLLETNEGLLKTLKIQKDEIDAKLKILEFPIDRLKRRLATIVRAINTVTPNLEGEQNTNLYVDLSEKHRQLLKLRAETVYYLPEAFEESVLITSQELLSVLKGMGMETDNIDSQSFYNFAMTTLELPVPYLPKPPENKKSNSNLSERYISQLNDIIRHSELRKRELLTGLRVFIGPIKESEENSHQNIKENPHQKEEKQLANSFMRISAQEEASVNEEAHSSESEKEKEASVSERKLSEKEMILINLFRNQNIEDCYKDEVEKLYSKAIPYPSQVFQILCQGLAKYQGFSFHISSEILPFFRALEKSLQVSYDVTDEFYETRNRIVRNHFNLEVLKIIREKFKVSLPKKE